MAKKRLDPIPPGEILLEDFMRPLGISINSLARAIDVPPNRVSALRFARCATQRLAGDRAPHSRLCCLKQTRMCQDCFRIKPVPEAMQRPALS